MRTERESTPSSARMASNRVAVVDAFENASPGSARTTSTASEMDTRSTAADAVPDPTTVTPFDILSEFTRSVCLLSIIRRPGNHSAFVEA